MSRPEEIDIIKHMNKIDLHKEIKQIEKEIMVLKRLKFIDYRYNGKSVEEAAKLVDVSKNTGYLWQKSWNENGYSGLKPQYKGGRPSKLNDEQKEILKSILNMRDHWNTKEVKEFIFKNFNVNYSLKQIRVILNEHNIRNDKPEKIDEKDIESKETEDEIDYTPNYPIIY